MERREQMAAQPFIQVRLAASAIYAGSVPGPDQGASAKSKAVNSRPDRRATPRGWRYGRSQAKVGRRGRAGRGGVSTRQRVTIQYSPRHNNRGEPPARPSPPPASTAPATGAGAVDQPAHAETSEQYRPGIERRGIASAGAGYDSCAAASSNRGAFSYHDRMNRPIPRPRTLLAFFTASRSVRGRRAQHVIACGCPARAWIAAWVSRGARHRGTSLRVRCEPLDATGSPRALRARNCRGLNPHLSLSAGTGQSEPQTKYG